MDYERLFKELFLDVADLLRKYLDEFEKATQEDAEDERTGCYNGHKPAKERNGGLTLR